MRIRCMSWLMKPKGSLHWVVVNEGLLRPDLARTMSLPLLSVWRAPLNPTDAKGTASSGIVVHRHLARVHMCPQRKFFSPFFEGIEMTDYWGNHVNTSGLPSFFVYKTRHWSLPDGTRAGSRPLLLLDVLLQQEGLTEETSKMAASTFWHSTYRLSSFTNNDPSFENSK